MRVVVHTDGSCRRNPDGPGGWAFVARSDDGQSFEGFGGSPRASNNQMEMTAVLEALRRIPDGSEVVVVSDSKYVVRGWTLWCAKWQQKGWRTSDGTRVLNRDLWEEGLRLIRRHRSVEFRWVRGHDGNRQNERAHELAASQLDIYDTDRPAWSGRVRRLPTRVRD